MKTYSKTLFLLFLSLIFTSCVWGQDVRLSQKGSVTQYINDTEEITIVYNRPVARGRTLFGRDGIVGYSRIWMPGANEATVIEFSTDVTLNGNEVKAGRYSIWTIPGPDEWTFILNTTSDVWHTNYPEGDDAVRFQVKSEKGGYIETMTFYFSVVEPGEATLHLHWGETIVPVDIRID